MIMNENERKPEVGFCGRRKGRNNCKSCTCDVSLVYEKEVYNKFTHVQKSCILCGRTHTSKRINKKHYDIFMKKCVYGFLGSYWYNHTGYPKGYLVKYRTRWK